MDSKRCYPWFDKLTMRAKPLKTRGLILSLSKDEAKGSIGLQQERRRSQPPRPSGDGPRAGKEFGGLG